MYYIIYQTTNLQNNKIYVGKHATNNLEDGYLGSGKLLVRAIRKYGVISFKKEILFVFNTEREANEKEKEIVTEAFCLREDTYNLCVGGQGGFSYINRKGLNQNSKSSPEVRKHVAEKLKGRKPASSVAVKKGHQQGKYKHTYFGTDLERTNKAKANRRLVASKAAQTYKKNIRESGKYAIIDNNGMIFNCLKDLAAYHNIPKQTAFYRKQKGVYKYMNKT